MIGRPHDKLPDIYCIPDPVCGTFFNGRITMFILQGGQQMKHYLDRCKSFRYRSGVLALERFKFLRGFFVCLNAGIKPLDERVVAQPFLTPNCHYFEALNLFYTFQKTSDKVDQHFSIP